MKSPFARWIKRRHMYIVVLRRSVEMGKEELYMGHYPSMEDAKARALYVAGESGDEYEVWEARYRGKATPSEATFTNAIDEPS